MEYTGFKYQNMKSLLEDLNKLGINLEASSNLDILKEKKNVAGMEFANRMVIHPMEGCDGTADGSPDELTIRRYDRFSKGGASLIWFEAVAVVNEGRANPRQLYMTDDNVKSFKNLFSKMRKNAKDENGIDLKIIVQLTHSGRYSKPNGKPEPIIACHDPILDKAHNIDPELQVATDDYLESLIGHFVKSAKLAYEAGADGVDIKACHRYLISELHSSMTRENSRYGGSYENRTKLFKSIISTVINELPESFVVTSRMNVYDGIDYPYGFGMNKTDYTKYDLTEPINLIKEISKIGVSILNITMGNPYYNPYINRPFDKGAASQPEHPLYGVERMLKGICELKQAVPEMNFIGSGYTFLREYSPYFAAKLIENNQMDFVGYGRMAFAYPSFAKDIIKNGEMDPKKVCTTCSKCTEIMRNGGKTGCVMRDSEVYVPLYRDCKK